MREESYLREFECSCGNKFMYDYTECEKDLHCESGDDLCSCCGVTYYTECQKCGKDAEYFSD